MTAPNTITITVPVEDLRRFARNLQILEDNLESKRNNSYVLGEQVQHLIRCLLDVLPNSIIASPEVSVPQVVTVPRELKFGPAPSHVTAVSAPGQSGPPGSAVVSLPGTPTAEEALAALHAVGMGGAEITAPSGLMGRPAAPATSG